jgi:hypothetical protein
MKTLAENLLRDPALRSAQSLKAVAPEQAKFLPWDQ